mmetsp:Transcript_10633/g.26570  ORF Transcript_10633/g.26570 Transcript_10633/m.26570 type:complete len:210 (-) Transcript_10633:117-746(-)
MFIFRQCIFSRRAASVLPSLASAVAMDHWACVSSSSPSSALVAKAKVFIRSIRGSSEVARAHDPLGLAATTSSASVMVSSASLVSTPCATKSVMIASRISSRDIFCTVSRSCKPRLSRKESIESAHSSGLGDGSGVSGTSPLAMYWCNILQAKFSFRAASEASSALPFLAFLVELFQLPSKLPKVPKRFFNPSFVGPSRGMDINHRKSS